MDDRMNYHSLMAHYFIGLTLANTDKDKRTLDDNKWRMERALREINAVKKIADDKAKKMEVDEEYDHCVECGKITQYKKTDHIDTRMYYIGDGGGQRCNDCGKKYC